ncbi:MAG: hypothetical protein OEQ53_19160 [Saprospiraceae bacterium]|nr:hypothetical protein [Saprospiraceae bacterium]
MSNKRIRFKPRPNYFWSVMSVAAVLFLLGLFLFLSLHSRNLVDAIKSDFEIVAELPPGNHDKLSINLQKSLSKDDRIQPETIRFIGKEEGLAALSTDLGTDLSSGNLPNPLNDIVVFKVKQEHLQTKTMKALEEEYSKAYPALAGVYFQEALIDQVVTNLDRLSVFLIVAGILLTILALTLIHNSIRLALYANRFLVKNMELVGASWTFIRAPFLKKSIRHGLFSASLALLMLLGLALLVLFRIPEMRQYLDAKYILYLVGFLLAGGLLINLASTYYVVTRFLRMRINDLHA